MRGVDLRKTPIKLPNDATVKLTRPQSKKLYHSAMLRSLSSILTACLIISGCNSKGAATTQNKYVQIVAPLIDPAKLDTLAGKRAATPRLRKVCYWLEMARRDGKEPGKVKSGRRRP